LSWPGLGVPLRLPRLEALLELVAVLVRESVGDVTALPRLGRGGSRLDDSGMTCSFFCGRRCTGRQGVHGERTIVVNVVTVLSGEPL